MEKEVKKKSHEPLHELIVTCNIKFIHFAFLFLYISKYFYIFI